MWWFCASAAAATYDPELTWRTIATEHFEIHFHQGEEALADEFTDTVEAAWDQMVAEVGWAPRRRVNLVLVDRTDQANGYATIAPRNTIVVYVTAPQEDGTLSLYEDWGEAIVTHELTHILHIDANHGLVRLARYVVGRVASTNTISPGWIVEGYATFEETRYTAFGRGRAPYVDMLLRTAALADRWPHLGDMDGFQPDPPSGNLRYLWGMDLIRYTAEHQGDRVWTRFAHRYGSGIPWLLPGRAALGAPIQRLYADWKADALARYQAQADRIRAEGIREGVVISAGGPSSCTSPAYAPVGEKVVWTCSDRATGPALWIADGDGSNARVLLPVFGAKNFTWRRDGQALAFASSHIVNRFNTWSDIYLLPSLDAERAVALTTGARARDPEFSPDGRDLLVVTNRVQQNAIERITVDRVREPIVAPGDHTQFATPRFAPDGRSFVVSVWADGRRDLWLYDRDGAPLRRLTADAAIDRDPRWSDDGRWLFFTSDRTGVPNVFAIEVATERLWQVTNVLTGASNPWPDPGLKSIVYQQYAQDGWEIRRMALAIPGGPPSDAPAWIDRGVLPRPIDDATPLSWRVTPVDRPPPPAPEASAWTGPEVRPFQPPPPPPDAFAPALPPDPTPVFRQSDGTDQFEQAEAGAVFGEEQDYAFRIAPKRYNPLRTIAPTFWLPYVQTTPYAAKRFANLWPYGVQLNAITGGTDILRQAAWTLNANWRSDADFFGGTATVSWMRWLPTYALVLSRQAVPIGRIQRDEGAVDDQGNPVYTDTGETYWERRHTAAFSVSWPYTYRSTVFARYAFVWRENKDTLPDDAVLVPVRGTLGSIAGGWRYAWSKQTSYAISTEDGSAVSVVGSLTHPWLGARIRDGDGWAPFTQAQLTADVREYVLNPWVPNHVLALRASAGVTLGSTAFQGNYQLGGSIGDAVAYSTPDELRLLRGYPTGIDVGDRYWLVGAEYRLPILQINRGVGTIPAFVRWISATAYVDAGNAFASADPWTAAVEDPLVGVGAELRLLAYVGWTSALNLRVGYGVGLTSASAIAWDAPEAWYLRAGASF